MFITDEYKPVEGHQPPSSASSISSADKAQEHKECLTASGEQQSEPDRLHLPLTSGSRSFDDAEQLLDVSPTSALQLSPVSVPAGPRTAALFAHCLLCPLFAWLSVRARPSHGS